MVADKDAELAAGYRLLEAGASERARLRTGYAEATGKVRASVCAFLGGNGVCGVCVRALTCCRGRYLGKQCLKLLHPV
jgi:hypothetical protein